MTKSSVIRQASRGSPKPIRGFMATVALIAFVAGCAPVGPNFTTPRTPVVKKWVAANSFAPSSQSGLTARSAPVVNWWQTFNDPILNDLVARAYAQNLSLQIAGARVLQARAQLGIAFGELYPQSQTLGGAASTQQISSNLGPISDIERVLPIDTTFSSNKIGFDAQWELDVWGSQRRLTQSANANLAAQIANYDDALVTLTGDVAAVYINIRTLQEALDIARANIKLQQQSANLTQLRFDNGITTELDVQEATTLLNNTKALVPGLETDLQQAKNALSVLLGQPPGAIDSLIGKYRRIPTASGKVAVGIPAALLRRRPDVRAAEMEAAAQSAQVGIALADLYPQFILSGAIGLQASGGRPLLSGNSATNLASAAVAWPIFNYGRIRNNVRAQDAQYQALVANYQNTVIAAYAEVENAMVAYTNARRQVANYRKSVDASRRAAKIALSQYEDGTADYSRVLNAQSALLRSEANLVEARSQVSANLVAIYKGLGGGWKIRQNQEFLPETVLAEMAHRTDWGDLIN
ncbi:efflux transporter outer membrane subunit [Aliiroseovarius sp. 2305UL8-7]|uniref:efflux transporter outer membrane subunit n=1 Tax=Aliiroseovarius conchicola TaxID=3121637 RepID=UPI0035284522